MNPLFKNSSKAFQAAARAQFRATPIGRSLSELEHYAKRGKLLTPQGKRILRRVRHLRGRDVNKQFGTTEIGRTVEKYAKAGLGSDEGARLVEGLLRSLGPWGDVLYSFIRPSGRQLSSAEQELKAAAMLLEAAGYDVRKPSSRSVNRGGTNSGDIDDMAATLEGLGFRVEPPAPAPPPREARETSRGEPRKALDVRVGGARRRFKTDDPILTGEMIDVNNSSNVHSIGFLWNYEQPAHGTLKVRFQQTRSGTKTKGPGPLYFYYNVNPAVFEAFRRASSKGEFIWDRIRVRGSQAGHRFHYELKGIVNGYVPRQAKRFGPNEYFVQRQVRGRSQRTGETRTFTSQLPDRRVQRAPRGSATVALQPDRGRPNRGR